MIAKRIKAVITNIGNNHVVTHSDVKILKGEHRLIRKLIIKYKSIGMRPIGIKLFEFMRELGYFINELMKYEGQELKDHDWIKIVSTLRFFEEHVEIIEKEIKK